MTARVINIPNATASVTRTNINDALAALGSTNSGATEPPGSLNNMLWYDTATHILKLKAEVGSDWISIGYFDQSTDTFRIFDDTQLVDASGTATDGVLGDQTTATWQAGTGTTESLVSPAKIKAAVDAIGYTQPTSLGAVGTYALLVRSTSGSTISEGTTYAGSGLRYTGFRVGIGAFYEAFCAGATGGTPSGTWRAMGTSNNNSGINPANIFLRIS